MKVTFNRGAQDSLHLVAETTAECAQLAKIMMESRREPHRLIFWAEGETVEMRVALSAYAVPWEGMKPK